jgi:hypothetical protein
LKTNPYNIAYQQKLIKCGYSQFVFDCNLEIFSGIIANSLNENPDCNPAIIHNSALCEMYTQFCNENNVLTLNEKSQKINVTLINDYSILRTKFKNKWDQCYGDSNRKRLFHMGCTPTGAMVEIKIDNEEYANLEIIYSLFGAILLRPHHNNKYGDNVPTILLKIVCESLRTYFPQIALYDFYIKNFDFEPREVLKKDLIPFQTIPNEKLKIYYDIYHDGSGKTTLRVVTFSNNNSSLVANAKKNNLIRDSIITSIEKPYKKYTKTIIKMIDELIACKFTRSSIDTIPDKEFVKRILTQCFDILRINGDRNIIKTISKYEMNEHENIVFSVDDYEKLDGYYIADKFSGEIFSYLVYENNCNKLDHIIIHTAYTRNELRNYGFIKLMYGIVIKYMHNTFNNFSFEYWIFTDKKQFLEDLLRDTIKETISASVKIKFKEIKNEYHAGEGTTHNIHVSVTNRNSTITQ